jgi:hypothetical protein
LGHSSFAYITTYDGTKAGLTQAYLNLHRWPPESSDTAWTDDGGYTIQDLRDHRVLPRPKDLTSTELETIAKAIIRNCQASAAHFQKWLDSKDNSFPERYTWDDPKARDFLFQYARKWEPGVVMPIDGKQCFVFGVVGG